MVCQSLEDRLWQVLLYILLMFKAATKAAARDVNIIKIRFIVAAAVILCQLPASVWWMHAGKADLDVLSVQRRLTGEIPAFCLLGDAERLPQHTRRFQPPRTTQEHIAAHYLINITHPYMIFTLTWIW